jgi:hypothetical protein
MWKVPKDTIQQLSFRKSLVLQADNNPPLAEQLWLACQRDILFFFNSFLFCYEPRSKRELPFNTWKFQDKAILKIRDAINGKPQHDVLVEKSRDMGASWICLGTFLHEWLFAPGASFLLGSRKEEYVDKPDDHKSLFWKIDFMIDRLPSWLTPKYKRTSMHLHNIDNGCSIDGESTNDNFARGDRRTAILLDEFAAVENGYQILSSTQATTNCRIFNSTPQGTANAFYSQRLKMSEMNPENILTLHWKLHPLKNPGLYDSDKDRKIRVIDKGHTFPSDYKFYRDGRLRSPAYDYEWERSPHPQLMAQEWDIDYLASDRQFFQQDVIERLIRENCRPPLMQGKLEYDKETYEVTGFAPEPKGKMRLWRFPNAFNQMARDRDYAIGVDVGLGVKATPSTIVVGDKKTSEKLLEFVCNETGPEALADLCCAVGRWFGGTTGEAFVVWERPGYGSAFRQRMLELGYTNLFIESRKDTVMETSTERYGWNPSDANKKLAMQGYKVALYSGNFINRSERGMKETLQYVFTTRGTVEHSASMMTDDKASKGKLHGDIVTADYLCCLGMGELQEYTKEQEIQQAPPNSIAGRYAEWQREQRLAGKW